MDDDRSTCANLPPKRKFFSIRDRLILKFFYQRYHLSISLTVDEQHLPLLVELCTKAAGKWRSIGIQLRVSPGELDAIQVNYHGHPQMVQNCLIDMFKWWLNNGQDVSPKKLAQAIHIIGEHDLEIKVKEKFGKYTPY